MARRPSILKKRTSPIRRSTTPRRLQFGMFTTVGTLPNYPIPGIGFLRRNYQTRPLTRNMFPAGAYGNSLYHSMQGQRQAQRARVQGRPRPTSANRQRALNAALAAAAELVNQVRRNRNAPPNSPPLRRQNSRNNWNPYN